MTVHTATQETPLEPKPGHDILPPGRHAVDGRCEERSRGGLHPCEQPPSMDNPVIAPRVQQAELGWTPHQAGDMTRLPFAPPWERVGSGLERRASWIVLMMPGPQTGPRHIFHQCGIKLTGSETVSPYLS